jgi:hypothetical protein
VLCVGCCKCALVEGLVLSVNLGCQYLASYLHCYRHKEKDVSFLVFFFIDW